MSSSLEEYFLAALSDFSWELEDRDRDRSLF